MGITWDPQLTVGFAEIDAQHQELFRRADRLLSRMEAGVGGAELAGLVEYLAGYVREHFGAEEGLMILHRYPLIGPHRAQHRGFVEAFVEIKGELERRGPSPELAERLSRFLVGWLRDHIATTDRALGEFLLASGAPART